MAYIQRANVILEVKDDQVDRFVNEGYDVIDMNTGKIITKSVPRDITGLTRAYNEHTEEIKRLKEENAKLTSEIKKLKSKSKAKAE